MLRWRLILGTLFIAILVGLCWLDFRAARPGLFLLPIALVLGLASVGELLAMGRRRDPPSAPTPWVVYGGVLLILLLAGAPTLVPASWSSESIGRLGWLTIGLFAAFVVAIANEMRRFESPGQATSRLAATCLVLLYVGGLFGFLVQLRLLDGALGKISLVALIATVKMSDTGQYFIGRAFGRHKLAPHISPGKTWEGVAGGAVFAIIGAGVTFWLAGHVAGVFKTVIYALALTAAGILGDLAESLLKRDAGVKDSSTWLPGFGGVLDMLDSLLVAAPVAYVFWALGWVSE